MTLQALLFSFQNCDLLDEAAGHQIAPPFPPHLPLWLDNAVSPCLPPHPRLCGDAKLGGGILLPPPQKTPAMLFLCLTHTKDEVGEGAVWPWVSGCAKRRGTTPKLLLGRTERNGFGSGTLRVRKQLWFCALGPLPTGPLIRLGTPCTHTP